MAAEETSLGYSVLQIEEHRSVGKPVECTGVVSKRAISMVKTDSIVNRVHGAHIYFPSGKNVHVSKNEETIIIDRERFIPGMKVAWIVTDSSVAPQEVEPFINAENFKYTPDWAYYGKRVEETVNRIMEGLGRKVDVAETLSSQKKHQRVYRDKNNTTLDSFF